MAMTKSQQTYALQRLKQIYEASSKELKEKYTTPAKTLSTEERLDLIYNSKVNLLPRSAVDSYTRLQYAYDFASFISAESMLPEGAKAMADLKTRYEDACDLVMLGDAVEALEAIQNFK